MTSNGVIDLILRDFTEFDRLGGRLPHRISSSSYTWPKLTYAAVARSLCNSWASYLLSGSKRDRHETLTWFAG